MFSSVRRVPSRSSSSGDVLLGEEGAVAIEFLQGAVTENLADRLAIAVLIVAQDEHEDARQDAGHQRRPGDETARRIPFEGTHHLALRCRDRTRQERKMDQKRGRRGHREREDRCRGRPEACGDDHRGRERRKQRRHSAPAEPGQTKR